MQSPNEYPEIEPPEDERGEQPVPPGDEVVPYAASKKAAKPSETGQGKGMEGHEKDLLEMQDSAKKRRAKLLEKGSDKVQKTEVVDVEDDAASKKSSGKGKGTIWTSEPPLPAGHWENRPRRDESKEALRKKLEEHKKEKLEEYHKQKLRDTFEKHLSGKGAGSDAPKSAGSEEGPATHRSRQWHERSTKGDRPGTGRSRIGPRKQ